MQSWAINRSFGCGGSCRRCWGGLGDGGRCAAGSSQKRVEWKVVVVVVKVNTRRVKDWIKRKQAECCGSWESLRRRLAGALLAEGGGGWRERRYWRAQRIGSRLGG